MEFVEGSAWGRVLNSEQLHRVRAEVRERCVPRGAVVCHAGAPVVYWKGMIEGLVKMSVASQSGRTSTLTGLAAGAWFGEGPVLRSATWDFDGVAMRDTRMALVPRATFHWLIEVSPGFNRFVIEQLNERLAQFLSVIEAERLEVAETRVARCLAWLFNPLLYPGVGARLELTQLEIGYLSGVSRQRVNRALQIMEAAGVLEIKYGYVHVLDLAALRQFRA
ncbi:MAG: Crp/Fnr family transcriptional regulator [Burkholderiaceae bacterium]|nr:Crp/Fnr family transcriptional regulator [Burkholderiaceae bacterium]